MAMSSDITVDTDVYSATIVKPRSTLRSDPTQPIGEPETLLVSHEIQSNGKVSSVVIFDDGTVSTCSDACDISPKVLNVRGMLKLQYNPTEGYPEITIAIDDVINKLKAFMADDALMDRFRNQEH